MAFKSPLDTIEIEILDDGTVKVTTDPISGPNHLNAEQFLAFMARTLGGTTQTNRRRETHRHIHKTLEQAL